MILVEGVCVKCGFTRTFVKDSPRHERVVCGNCWDWVSEPPKALDLCGGKI